MEIINLCFSFAENILSVLNKSQCQSLMDQFVKKKIIKNKKQKFKCIFNGKLNGFDAVTFHSLCNGKGPTLVAIRSNFHFTFGGFTHCSWEKPNGFSQYA